MEGGGRGLSKKDCIEHESTIGRADNEPEVLHDRNDPDNDRKKDWKNKGKSHTKGWLEGRGRQGGITLAGSVQSLVLAAASALISANRAV